MLRLKSQRTLPQIIEELKPIKKNIDNIKNSFADIKSIITDYLAKWEFPLVDVCMYGSCTNGLLVRGQADLDITIIIKELYIKHELILKNLSKVLQKKGVYPGRYKPG